MGIQQSELVFSYTLSSLQTTFLDKYWNPDSKATCQEIKWSYSITFEGPSVASTMNIGFRTLVCWFHRHQFIKVIVRSPVILVVVQRSIVLYIFFADKEYFISF